MVSPISLTQVGGRSMMALTAMLSGCSHLLPGRLAMCCHTNPLRTPDDTRSFKEEHQNTISAPIVHCNSVNSLPFFGIYDGLTTDLPTNGPTDEHDEGLQSSYTSNHDQSIKIMVTLSSLNCLKFIVMLVMMIPQMTFVLDNTLQL